MAAPATAAASPSGAVHRAWHRFPGTLDNRAFTNEQKSFFDQSSRNNRPGAIENASKRGSRDPHPFRGRFLVQALEIGEAQGLEFVGSQDFDLELRRRATDGFEGAPLSQAADLSEFLGPSHGASSYEHMLKTIIRQVLAKRQ
jgi:hypothetical protein